MKRNLLFCLISICFFVQVFTVIAQDARPLESDAVIEARVQQLSEELRCLVCQNQTLADSHAGLALDLKREIREMITQGMSNQAVIDYLVSRYGDFVLYRPPFKLTTLLLWLGPFMLMLIGVMVFLMALKKRTSIMDEPLSANEKRKINELLDVNRE